MFFKRIIRLDDLRISESQLEILQALTQSQREAILAQITCIIYRSDTDDTRKAARILRKEIMAMSCTKENITDWEKKTRKQ